MSLLSAVAIVIILISLHSLNFCMIVLILYWNFLCVSAESGGAGAEIADN